MPMERNTCRSAIEQLIRDGVRAMPAPCQPTVHDPDPTRLQHACVVVSGRGSLVSHHRHLMITRAFFSG